MKKSTVKKLTALFVSLLLAFGFAACGNNENSGESTAAPSSENTNEADSKSGNAGAGKTLVVYFSATGNTEKDDVDATTSATINDLSATGNTEKAANFIAKVTNGDTFQLVLEKPYSNDDLDWTNNDSRIMREHENPDERDIEFTKATADDWGSYDTVFIGYPIWWGSAAWPIGEFVETNDFTGKNVIPFCTSANSGLGDSGKLLENQAGTGNWMEGKRFSPDVSESEVQEWINDLNL